MAGGESLGNLYFDLGLDDQTFEAIFNATMKKYDNKFNIKVGVDATGLKDIKAQIDAISKTGIKSPSFLQATKANNSVLESAQKQILLQQKINTELERTALAHKRNESFGTQSQSRIRSNAEFTNKTLLSQRQIAMQLSNQFGTMFSIYAVERFVKKLAEVRGGFEQQKIALSAILQDGQQANIIFEQIKNLSVESPFKFKDLVGYTKQLSAFQIPASELFDTMKRLADVSSGLGVGMDRVVLAFGQVRSASVLRGQELRQFSEMGIPMIQMLADKFSLLEKRTVSTGDVFERISKRMVSFNDVKDIFDDMTGAGGKFYEMQEKQAKGLLGMMTNLQDAIDIALNDIGETNEGVLKGAVQLTTTLINNWESVARIVMAAVTAYGAYKGVLLLTAAVQSKFVGVLVGNIAVLAAETVELGFATAAQRAFNMAVSANPLMLFAGILATVVGAMVLFGGGAESSKDKIEAMNKSIAETSKSTAKVDELVNAYERLSNKSEKTADEQKRLQSIVKELAILYPNLVSKTDSYGHALDINIQKIKNYSAAMKQVSLELARNSIESAKSEIATKQARQREIDATLASGKSRKFVPSETGGSYITEKLSLSEKERLSKEYAANQLAVDGFLGTIQNAAALINSIKGNSKRAKEEMADWALWAKNFKKQTDDLNITGSISSLFTQQSMEGGSAEFKASLEKAYEDDLKQYKIYLKSKNVLSGLDKEELDKQTSDLKKKVADEKRALQLLGGTKEENKVDKKDKDAIRLENNIKLVKALYSEYENLEKVQKKDRAKELISKAPEYANSREKLASLGVSISFSEEELNKQILALIARAEQTPGVKKIGASWAANINKGFYEGFNQTYESAIKAIEQTISDYKPKYDLYEKLLGLTGDRKKSSQLAFGKDAVDDYETFLREQYAKTPGASFFSELTPPAEGATEEVKKAWKDLVEYIQSKKLGKIEYFEQMISEAASASDKIKKIELDRERDIADAEKAYATDPERKKIAIDAAKSKADGQINEIRSTLFQLTPLYDEVFKDLGKVAIGNLDDLLSKTKGLVNILRDESKTEVKKDASGRITGYFIKKDTIDPSTGLKIEKDTLVSVEKYNELLERSNTIVNKINENPFKALFNPAKGDAPETTEERLARIGKGIAGLSELAQSVAGDLGGIMDSFGASAESQAALKNITDIAGGAASIATGIMSGDPIAAIKGVVGGIGKIIGGLNAMHDAKYEKQIKAYQKQIDATVKSYDNLTDALSRKTAASKVDAQAEEYVLLQREKNLLESQKRAEESKKKTDQSKIDDYNKQIEDTAKKQQELALNTISYVLGGNIGSQADSWAKTLTDAMDTAFQNGTDAAQAWGDSVDGIVRDIAKNFIVNGILGKKLQDWLETASSDWTDAGGKANQKNIEEDLKGFSVFAKSLEPATEAALKALNSIYGDGTSSSSSTLSSNIKSVTEDTANRLAGMINSIRQDSAVNRISLSTIRDIMQSFSGGNIEANSYLQKMDANIRQNTLNTTAILSAIQDVTTNGANGKALKMA